MSKRGIVNVVAILVLAAALSGCSKPPIQEEKAAEAAIENARSLAEIYAPKELEEAIAAFDRARLEIEGQHARSEMVRSYGDAQQLMLDAKAAAERAHQVAEANKQKAADEVEMKLADAETAIADTKETFKGVRRTRSNQTERQRIEAELDGLISSLETAREMVSEATYLDVIKMAEDLRRQADEIMTELEEMGATRATAATS